MPETKRLKSGTPEAAQQAIGKLSAGLGNPAVRFGGDITVEEAVVELALRRLKEAEAYIAALELANKKAQF